MANSLGSIIITGASAGIGRALAEAYAADGVALGLVGRDGVRLEEISARCRALGATVDAVLLDVRDGVALTRWITSFASRHGVDLLVANAGVTASSIESELEPREIAQTVIDVNLGGAINAVYAVLPSMRARGGGQIALVSSIAAWRGMALTPVYCASKAGVKAYGEALRDLLGPEGIKVSVICPGFVETSMSASFPGARPNMMSTVQAARNIQNGLSRGVAYVLFPKTLAWGMRVLSLLPFGFGSWCLRVLSLQPRPH